MVQQCGSSKGPHPFERPSFEVSESSQLRCRALGVWRGIDVPAHPRHKPCFDFKLAFYARHVKNHSVLRVQVQPYLHRCISLQSD